MIGERVQWELYGHTFRGTVTKVYPDDSPFYAGMLYVKVDDDTIVIHGADDSACVFVPGSSSGNAKWLMTKDEFINNMMILEFPKEFCERLAKNFFGDKKEMLQSDVQLYMKGFTSWLKEKFD